VLAQGPKALSAVRRLRSTNRSAAARVPASRGETPCTPASEVKDAQPLGRLLAAAQGWGRKTNQPPQTVSLTALCSDGIVHLRAGWEQMFITLLGM